MNKHKIAQLILNHLNGDINNLTKEYICEVGKIAPEEAIVKAFGSFDDFISFTNNGLEAGDLHIANPQAPNTANESNEEAESSSSSESSTEGYDDSSSGGQKTVRIVTNDGSVFKATVPAGMKLKDILSAAKVDVEEGFEVRVNNVLEDDMDTVPDDGARISAMRQVKGNE